MSWADKFCTLALIFAGAAIITGICNPYFEHVGARRVMFVFAGLALALICASVVVS